RNSNFKTVCILACLVSMVCFHPVFAQEADTVAEVVDTATASVDETAETSADTAAVDAVAEEGGADTTSVDTAAAPTAAAGATPTATTVEEGAPSIPT